MSRLLLLAAVCHLTLLVDLLSAHYLWVTVQVKRDAPDVTNIYFEEAPSAGDGHYLDHFTKTSRTTVTTIDEPQPTVIKTRDTRLDDKRWLRAELKESAPRSIDCYGKFGVYAYGETKVLLHYYARHLEVSTHDDLHELGRAEQLDLDIVPHDVGDEVELAVLWQGEPVAGRRVFIRGPKKFRQNPTTDEKGRVRFQPPSPGRYTFRSSVEFDTPGEEEGEAYEKVRHNGTLIMTLPLNN